MYIYIYIERERDTHTCLTGQVPRGQLISSSNNDVSEPGQVEVAVIEAEGRPKRG